MRKLMLRLSAGAIVGFTAGLNASSAFAGTTSGSGNDFSFISNAVSDSMEDFPKLVSVISYMLALLFGVMGVLKIKEHVENPSQVKLNEAVPKLVASGLLLALPLLTEVVLNSVGGEGDAQKAPELYKATTTLK